MLINNSNKIEFGFQGQRPIVVLWIALLFSLFCFYQPCAAEQTTPVAEPVEFHRQIAPILKAKCHACHGGKIHESDLWLDQYEKVMEGGASGKIVIPGNAEKSSLYRVAARLEEPAMPPLPNDLQIAPLTADELELLRRWIDDGAVAGKTVAPQSTRWRPISPNQKQIYSLALSPDQRTLAVGQANQIILYDMIAKRELERLVPPFLEGVADVDFIQALAFSPDGERIASGGYRNAKIWKRAAPRAIVSQKFDHPVRHARVDNEGIHAAFLLENSEILLWNLVTGELGHSISANDDPANDMAFIPSQNRLIVGRQSGKTEIRSLITGELEAHFQTSASITSVQMLQSDTGFVTTHADGIIRIWPDVNEILKAGLESVKPVRELRNASSPVVAICVLPQSSKLLSAMADQTLQLSDLSTGTILWTRTVDEPVTMLAVSEVANRLVIAGPDGTVHLWDIDGHPVASGRAAAPLVRQLNEALLSLELARRKNQRATGKLEQSEKDLTERKRLLTIAQEERQQAEEGLEKENLELQALLTEQQQAQDRVNTAPDDEPLQQTLKQTLAEINKRREGKSELVEKAQLRLQTMSRAVTHAEQSVQVGVDQLHRRRSSVEQIHEELEATESRLAVVQQQADQSGKTTNSITISQEGQLVLASAPRESLRAWSLATGTPVDMPVLSGRPAQQVIALPLGKVLKIDTQGTAVLWDLTPHWQLDQVLGPPLNEPTQLEESRIIHRVNTLAFHPRENRLVTGGGDPSRSGEVLLWNLDTPEPPLEFRDAHSDTVLDLQFSRDGLKLVTCGADKFCRFFDVSNRTLMKSFEGHTDHVMGVALSLDEELLVSGGADQLIKVWDAETGELKRTIDTPTRQVTSVHFLGPSSEQILSSSGDHHVRIHVAATGKLENTFAESKGYVYVVIVTANGRQIIAGGEDGIVRIWEVQTGKLEELSF